MPLGRVTRIISRTADAGSGRKFNTRSDRARSKVASEKRSADASPTWKRTRSPQSSRCADRIKAARWVNACHPHGWDRRGGECQRPGATPDVEHLVAFADAGELHQQRRESTAPAAHEAFVAVALGEHPGLLGHRSGLLVRLRPGYRLPVIRRTQRADKEATMPSRFDVRDLAVPVIVAPMAGGPSTPELAAAGTNAGGLGFVAAGYLTADGLADRIVAARKLTAGPLGVNLFVPQPSAGTPAQIEAYAAALAPEAQRYGVQLGDPHLQRRRMGREARRAGGSAPGGGVFHVRFTDRSGVRSAPRRRDHDRRHRDDGAGSRDGGGPRRRRSRRAGPVRGWTSRHIRPHRPAQCGNRCPSFSPVSAPASAFPSLRRVAWRRPTTSTA